ncbi:hypothetical protein EON80_10585 [bacterium]|nr:MAG: hypothetical protein EON80_10585 [bacterium]
MKFVEDLVAQGKLGADDATDFWEFTCGILMKDAARFARYEDERFRFYLNIGLCSHWLRPHQTRWKADGGFAWPQGYGPNSRQRDNTPEFDWDEYLEWNAGAEAWEGISRNSVAIKQRYVLRAALPARTARHDQAAVRAEWVFGLPQVREPKPTTFYGFRKIEGQWVLRAWSEDEALESVGL